MTNSNPVCEKKAERKKAAASQSFYTLRHWKLTVNMNPDTAEWESINQSDTAEWTKNKYIKIR